MLIACASLATIGVLMDRGGVDRRSPDKGAIRIVHASAPVTHHLGAVPPSPMVETGIGVSARVRDGRNWDDGGAALRAMASDIRAEPRDPAWASASETQLRAELTHTAPRFAPRAEVRCAATLCEIVGALPASGDADTVLQSLQDADMRTALSDATLVGGPSLGQGALGGRYVLYFRRRSG